MPSTVNIPGFFSANDVQKRAQACDIGDVWPFFANPSNTLIMEIFMQVILLFICMASLINRGMGKFYEMILYSDVKIVRSTIKKD